MDLLSSAFSLDFRKFRVLKVLHDSGSVNATANILHLTPSAVSQQISNLAKELGAPLVMSHGRGVRLTPQATILLNHVQAIDHQVELVRADMASFNAGQLGHLVVGAFASSIPQLVTPVVNRLAEERPKLRVSIHEFDTPVCFAHLDACDLDLVVAVHFPNHPLHAAASYFKLDLLQDRLLLAIHAGHPLAEREHLSIKDLADQPWILAPASAPCREMTLAACLAAGFQPNIVHNVDDWFSVLTLVAANTGVAVVPRLAIPKPFFPELKFFPPANLPYDCRHVFLAVRAGSETNPCIQPVIHMFQEVARELAEKDPFLGHP